MHAPSHCKCGLKVALVVVLRTRDFYREKCSEVEISREK